MLKLKSLVVASLLCVFAACNLNAAQDAAAQDVPQGQLQWMTNYRDAAQKAKAEKKPILLFFTGSDWCGWCKKMENEILGTPEFASAAAGKFIFVFLDFPMNKTLPSDITAQNAELKQKYGVTGYPTVILLDSNENFLAETGYRSGGGKSYADYLMNLVH